MRIINKTTNNNFGFSLIELLVSIFILTLITSVSVVNFISWKRDENFKQSIFILTDNIKKIQAMSLTGQTYNGVSPIAYGIYFDEANPSSYITFADMDGDYVFDDDGTEIMNTYNLSDDVVISDLTPAFSNKLTITFKLPKAEIYINQNTTDSEADIEITHNIISKTKIIKLKRITGRIDID